jgi:anaerobic dimethyl sulfoxide reductase subunit A
VRPGTDAAALLAMAHVVIKENLQDQVFIDQYTTGYGPFKAYVLGEEDGVEKTPEWASAISGVPAASLVKLAREFATMKPAVLVTSIGPGRSAMGEQYHRAAHALEAITGNTAFQNWQSSGSFRKLKFSDQLASPPNPVEEGMPQRNIALPYRSKTVNSSARVNVSSFANAILKGKAGGYPAEYKAIWLSNTNYLNQLGDVNTTARAFNQLDFVLVTEQFMTPTARYADIVLPVCTFLERDDIVAPRSGQVFAILNKAIEPLGESKSQREICQLLAKKLGLEEYGDQPAEVMVKSIVRQAAEQVDLPDFEILKKEGMYRVKSAKPPGTQKDKPEEPGAKPLKTPSGKIEIYSGVALAMNDPRIPALPEYLETWEGLNDPLAKTFPLQLISPHFKRRAHSQFDNLPWLRELQTQALSINTVDAAQRGIQQGDLVRVFNHRGEVRISAKVTERIMPGVVALPQGAWFTPDENGIDHGGCVNVLTKNEISPGGAFACNTALVQVERVVNG